MAIYIARKILKEDKGPLFYEQLRYGKNGKVFRLYKFRSMCVDADKKLKEYLEKNEEARVEFEENHKLQYDPRITKLGDFLRKTSLDELPQMLNILKGDMSIVGPRPLLVEYLKLYNEEQKHRHDVRPGLTGLAQTSGRNAITWEEKFEKDIEYVHNISFIGDVKIIIKTAIKVFKREGISGTNSDTMQKFEGNKEKINV